MATALSVNLNAVAQIRNRRDLPWPSVTGLGRTAMRCGAHGLTVHPRPDQRHIRFSDLPDIRKLLDQEFPDGEFNIEGYPTPQFVDLVMDNQPDQVTLVPDDPAQATSDHGWDFRKDGAMLADVIGTLKAAGMRVSVFVNPEPADMALARGTGTDRVELYTGPYGACFHDEPGADVQLKLLIDTARAARESGLGVNAGHDLTVDNLPALCRAIPDIAEVSIGHALTALALEHGMAGAVKQYLNVLGG